MNKLLLGSVVAVAILAFSGCTYKTATAPVAKAKSVCIGCENLPDCVPGPYGDCLPTKK